MKLIKRDDLDLDKFKNAQLNMAIPAMQLSEPGPPVKYKIKEGLSVDTWTRWDIEVPAKTKMGAIVSKLQS